MGHKPASAAKIAAAKMKVIGALTANVGHLDAGHNSLFRLSY
jgi:hypothetical protein